MPVPAAFLLNDTFPNPFGILIFLASWVVPIVMTAWVGRRVVRREPVPWPSPIFAVLLFIGIFVVAILADMRFPTAPRVESAVGAVATCILFPALMLAMPLDLVHPIASQSSAADVRTEHLALAIAGTIFWYAVLLARNLLRANAASHEKPTAPDERPWVS